MIAVVTTPLHRVRDSQVADGVRRYCRRMHYDPSTTESAINWALRAPGSTLTAIRSGHDRADQLHHRVLANQPQARA